MNFFETIVTKQARQNANKVLFSEHLSEGKWVEDFEEKLKEKFDFEYGFTVNSGTSALHLALILAGVREGDEVILPAQTFIATGLSILYCKAKPIFCDIEKESGNIDFAKIKELITEKTKVLLVVSWGGNPCEMTELENICKHYNLKLIQDNAHALGSAYFDLPLHHFGDFSIYSFQSIKTLTTGDGGLVICKDKEDEDRGKRLRWFGIDRLNDLPDELGERVYDLKEIGYKYHLNNISAAIGLGNLDDFWYRQGFRNEVAKIYNEELGKISGITLLDICSYKQHCYWLYTILVENRTDFLRKMKENNIPVSVVHLGIDKNSIFGGKQEQLINQRYWDTNQISLPIHHKLNPDDYWLIIDTIKRGW